MENRDFVERLNRTFDGATMAAVAKRLGIPHATVRNYYNGRLPAPEVLMKIASSTGVSLNWLLLGRGEMFVGETGPVGLGRFIELKIADLIDKKLDERLGRQNLPLQEIGGVDVPDEFNIEDAIIRFDDPQRVMRDWFGYEGRELPQDFGVAFFQGWKSFSLEQKVAAVRDAKKLVDHTSD